MASSSHGKSLGFGIGAILLLVSAARLFAGRDLVGALIAGGAGLMAVHGIRQTWIKAAKDDSDSSLS